MVPPVPPGKIEEGFGPVVAQIVDGVTKLERVSFDSRAAAQAALARRVDLLIVDTAGRLHTRFNLMEELKKVHRVLGKVIPGAPHHTWLVLDASTGQNALAQAAGFREAVSADGVILAKLDSSAHGGMSQKWAART